MCSTKVSFTSSKYSHQVSRELTVCFIHHRLKDYQKVHDGRKYNIKYRDAVASIAINDIMADDTGVFTCEATNQYGFTSTSARLHMSGEETSDVRLQFIIIVTC